MILPPQGEAKSILDYTGTPSESVRVRVLASGPSLLKLNFVLSSPPPAPPAFHVSPALQACSRLSVVGGERGETREDLVSSRFFLARPQVPRASNRLLHCIASKINPVMFPVTRATVHYELSRIFLATRLPIE